MNINATLANGRCYFNGFNHANDKDQTTKKSGVNYYHCIWIGFILEKLGFVYKIKCNLNDRPGILYVNKNSFLKWLKRHEINFSERTLTVNNILLAIRSACEKNPKKVLSLEEVMKKANSEFFKHSEKKNILQRIRRKLYQQNYRFSILNASQPHIKFNLEDILWGDYEKLSDKDKLIIGEATRFLENLPGISKTYLK